MLVNLTLLPLAQMFLIRATQLMPHARFNDFEKSATASLSAHGTYATAFKVSPTRIPLYDWLLKPTCTNTSLLPFSCNVGCGGKSTPHNLGGRESPLDIHTFTVPVETFSWVDVVRAVQVAGGGTLEITLGQFWSSLGESSLDAELEFHGAVAEPSSISLDGSAGALPSYLAPAQS